MALTGNFLKYSYTESSEIVSHSVTYPSDLPESSPNYDLRGTTELTSGSIWTKTSESMDNVYLKIHNYSHFTLGNVPSDGDDNLSPLIKNNVIQVTYRIYNSKAEAIENYNSHIHSGDASFSLVGDDLADAYNNPSYEDAYTRLKTLEGFENLTNA